MVIGSVDEIRGLLRAERARAGLFTQAAADRAKLSRSTLNRMEIGPEEMKVHHLLKALEAYGLVMVIQKRGGNDDA